MQSEGPGFYAHLPLLSTPGHVQTFCDPALVENDRLPLRTLTV